MIKVQNRLGMEFTIQPDDEGVTVTHGNQVIVLPLSEAQFKQRFTAWKWGMKIQDAFPELTASQREFLLTGLTDEEYDLL